VQHVLQVQLSAILAIHQFSIEPYHHMLVYVKINILKQVQLTFADVFLFKISYNKNVTSDARTVKYQLPSALIVNLHRKEQLTTLAIYVNVLMVSMKVGQIHVQVLT
jgi:hypothetical protein